MTTDQLQEALAMVDEWAQLAQEAFRKARQNLELDVDDIQTFPAYMKMYMRIDYDRRRLVEALAGSGSPQPGSVVFLKADGTVDPKLESLMAELRTHSYRPGNSDADEYQDS